MQTNFCAAGLSGSRVSARNFHPLGCRWRMTEPPCRPVAPVTSTSLSAWAINYVLQAVSYLSRYRARLLGTAGTQPDRVLCDACRTFDAQLSAMLSRDPRVTNNE